MKPNLTSGMQASQGAATIASQEASALNRSIAKHEPAYSYVCGVLGVERAGNACDADQSEMMRRLHEETSYFTNEAPEAKADNEQFTFNLKETIADLREERKRRAFPARQHVE